MPPSRLRPPHFQEAIVALGCAHLHGPSSLVTNYWSVRSGYPKKYSKFCGEIHKEWTWLASILIINTLTLLTIAHGDRERPTLKDDERFRNGLVRDLDNRTLMCTRSNICLHVLLNRFNLLLGCTEKYSSNTVDRRTNNIDEVNFEVTYHAVVMILISEEIRHMNAVWKYVTNTCTNVIFLISFIACIVYCDVIQNIVDDIQHFIVSYISRMYFIFISSIIYDHDYAVHSHILPNKSGNMLPSNNPVSLDIKKSETLHTTNERRSR